MCAKERRKADEKLSMRDGVINALHSTTQLSENQPRIRDSAVEERTELVGNLYFWCASVAAANKSRRVNNGETLMLSQPPDDRHCSSYRYYSNGRSSFREMADESRGGGRWGRSHLTVFVRRRFLDYNASRAFRETLTEDRCRARFIAARINDLMLRI